MQKIDFAYKYPFSEEAKEIISSEKIDANNIKYLNFGKIRVEEALNNNKIAYQKTEYESAKKDFIIAYVFARIIVSALKNKFLLNKYVDAEAKRCIEAIESGDSEEIMKLSKEIGINIKIENNKDQELFAVKFTDFLNDKENTLNLANLKLHSGLISLEKYNFLKFFEKLIKNAIKKNLPIKYNDIPITAFEIAKQIKVNNQENKTSRVTPEKYVWIEKLIKIPIPDVRHRIVNLIFAPYFITIKKFSEEKAFEIISEYIEKCKELEGNTKINDRYIKYQCKYSKDKKMRPLTFEKSKELLKGIIDLEELKE